MKRVLALVILLFAFQAKAQNSLWKFIHPYPQPHTLNDVDFADSLTAYAVGNGATIIKTTDGGSTWERQDCGFNQFSSDYMNFVSVSFINPLLGFAVGKWSDGYMSGTYYGQIYQTIDGGINWNHIYGGREIVNIKFLDEKFGYVNSFYEPLKTINGGLSWIRIVPPEDYMGIMSFSDMNNATFITGGYPPGIYRTFDGGITWVLQLNEEMYTVYSFDSLNVIAAGPKGRIIKTEDAGQTWKITKVDTTIDLINIEFSDRYNGLLITNKDSLIFRTTDGGDSWTPIIIEVRKNLYENIGLSLYGGNGIIIWENNILKSTNKGLNWIKTSSSITRENLNDVVFTSESRGIITGDSGTILHTSDGGTNWIKISTGTNLNLKGIYFFNSDKGIVVGDSGIILNTSNGGLTWSSRIISTSTSFNSINFMNSDIGLIVGMRNYNSGAIFKTTDGGMTWTEKLVLMYNYFNKVLFLDSGNAVISGENYSWDHRSLILYSPDKGETWGNRFSELQHNINNLKKSGILYGAGTFYYEPAGPPGTYFYAVLKSTNSGLSWSVASQGGGFGFNDIAFFDDSYGLAVGTRGAISETTDGGINWNTISANRIYLKSVTIINSNTAIAVGNRGTIIKYSKTNVPVEMNSLLVELNKNIVMLQWSTSSELNNKGFEVERKSAEGNWEIRGFIKGTGTSTEIKSYSFTEELSSPALYSYRLKQIDFDGSFEYSNGIEVDFNPTPKYSLSQCYPNPFNPTTKINYSIAQEGRVSLIIYDVLGREVKKLFDEEKPIGNYNIEFDAYDLSSGIYFYKLQSGDYSETKKMVLMK